MVAEKGRRAAEALSAFDFDQHRWTRYLISMGRLQDAVHTMDERYGPTAVGKHDGMRDVLDKSSDFTHYSRTKDWSIKARGRTETLLGFAVSPEPDFAVDAPKPEPVLRISPRF
jgi:hypothetical protein